MRRDIGNCKYLRKDDVENELASFFAVLKAACMALVKQTAATVSSLIGSAEARKLEQELSKTVNDALKQMSINGEYIEEKKKS